METEGIMMMFSLALGATGILMYCWGAAKLLRIYVHHW